jgi:hypothetical protein
VHTHQGWPARVRGPVVDLPAVDIGQLAALTRCGLVDFGASWTPYCCYFRTCCLALSVPCRLQGLPTSVRPFAMYQNWCWSSGSSASCLCFCSAFFLCEVKSRSELENGSLCPSPLRNLSSLSRIAFFDATGPLHTIPRL